ncbi:PQ loop repeat-domain-containing protein [Daldinia vernicosa]|uniref:PQ loop repeat-domain-containing protein n=1 Tax=Daldinia vernicosa TaxID=114800 RepID=UPI002008D121|nr:PQ loop repeat-domain-containing protein [Daldinia vernicosa]KAI0845650.1 PQ loop repeat-domain-containing protein [Daldinia vernicosa]
MAPQQDIPVAANVLGTIGTILWCVQTIPQIWTNWRTKKTDGLPGSMMYLWALCKTFPIHHGYASNIDYFLTYLGGVPFGAYNIVQRFNYPLQVQPQAFMALCLVNWCQILLYNSKWPMWKVVLIGLVNAAAFAGVQAALIVTLRPLYDAGNGTGVLVIGIIANILLAVGLLPPYGELWKRRGRVIGINFVFLSMDWLGAFFSLMSLAAQNSFDILGGVLYIVCILLESGIFLSHLIWLFRTRKLRKDAASRGKTFEDIVAEHEQQGISFKFAERRLFKKNDVETGNAGHCEDPSGQTQQYPITTVVQDGGLGGPQQSLNSELEREASEKMG